MSYSEHDRAPALAGAICVLSAFGLLAAAGCAQAAGTAKAQRTAGSAKAWWVAAHPGTGSGWRIRTIAGGVGGPGPARTVSIAQPCGVTSSGKTLLVGTADGVVRAVSARTGWLTTPAGVGISAVPSPTFTADGP